MYESFYGLTEKPFSIQPDPEFLFFSRRHSLACAMLEYGIRNRSGFSVISGEIGCGKTTLVRHLLTQLGADVRVGMVYNTHQDIADLLEWIMLAFEQPYEGLSQVAMYDRFQRFLIDEYAAGRRVLLIVDEAQNLNASALESLRMLSNINADKHQLLQILLVGQPQLNDMLQRPEMRQFAQRVAVQFFIPPFELPEVERYIRHRLKVAGRSAQLFTLKACEKIAEATNGIPRSINILCDTALVYGYSMEAEWIDDELIDEVLQDRATYGGALAAS
ncbi:general secretion pathway protein [Alkalilimnicola ehrlichii]|uniref:General secretion pathway protein n=1 Tax=Alkalilimnicola ehrlichii TaxID=351052 RepID=A0A3E0WXG2_9GAMM|nr:AAA family ATPase [Alkalilimnicola ehrlichii]RFA29338.1 general secretion pathway protein [Alkalilimnicola ehrlichii]RFA36853.1 general secretion pathway protein [Alkalilimnicola ehrlichii]